MSFRRLCESAVGRATSSRFQPRIFPTDCFINTNEIFSNFLQWSSQSASTSLKEAAMDAGTKWGKTCRALKVYTVYS